MSLILEALRRSEADRRRAQAPDLFAGPQLAARAAAGATPRWLWPSLGLLALVATAWLARAWWTPAAATDAAAPVPVVGAPAVDVPVDVPSQAVRVATAPPAMASTPAPAATLPAPTASVPPPVAIAEAASVATVQAPTPLPAAPQARPVPVSTPAPSAPAAAAVATLGTGNTAGATAPLLLSELGHAERQALPPLKLSMHMWHDAPAQRFAIVDGQRVGEGDRVGDAVVARIAEDGVVLAWRGREVKLPLP